MIVSSTSDRHKSLILVHRGSERWVKSAVFSARFNLINQLEALICGPDFQPLRSGRLVGPSVGEMRRPERTERHRKMTDGTVHGAALSLAAFREPTLPCLTVLSTEDHNEVKRGGVYNSREPRTAVNPREIGFSESACEEPRENEC